MQDIIIDYKKLSGILSFSDAATKALGLTTAFGATPITVAFTKFSATGNQPKLDKDTPFATLTGTPNTPHGLTTSISLTFGKVEAIVVKHHNLPNSDVAIELDCLRVAVEDGDIYTAKGLKITAKQPMPA